MTLTEYLRLVADTKAAHPGWRVGQTYANVLAAHRPELYLAVEGTSADTFYSDAGIGDLLDFLLNRW